MAQLPATIDVRAVLDRYSKGETIKAIAADIGCSNVAVYNRLLAEAPDEWKTIASSNALLHLDQAEEDLKTAPDMLSVTRARGWADIQRWKLERLLRRYFGQDQAANAAPQVAIQINLRRGEKPLESVEATVLARE